jgi:hypothetical protein
MPGGHLVTIEVMSAAVVAAMTLVYLTLTMERQRSGLLAVAAKKNAADSASSMLEAANAENRAAAGVAAKEISRLRHTLTLKTFASAKLCITIPIQPPELEPTAGWSRCELALQLIDETYLSKKKRGAYKTELKSSYDLERAGGVEKVHVDALLAEHAAKTFDNLAADMRADSSLVLLLLEAPSCASTQALVAAMPQMAEHCGNICIPQADPNHYRQMISGATADVRVSPLLLNVRCQRLDEWLTNNASLGLRVPIFFADYETTIYGKSGCSLSPLRDVQRFLRHGYAHSTCLVAITLSYRGVHEHFYPSDAPQLTTADLDAFVTAEAAAQGMVCECIETVRYGMTFSLFRLTGCGMG